MALDDPVPGSNWVGGGHWYGEPIPKVKPKAKPAPAPQWRGSELMGPAQRRSILQGLQNTRDTKGRMMTEARRRAIASLQNRQDA
jgi:hypothetical protein